MTYRKAEILDIPELIELRKYQLIEEGGDYVDIDLSLQAYFLSSLENHSLIVWIAEDEATIIATGGICFYQLPPTFTNPSGRIAYVTNMYTKSDYRNREIATKLLGLVVEEGRRLNYKAVRLHASSKGRSIYMKNGFEDSEGYMALKSN